ncbi:uncharacterized protein GGS22DRAFT_158982 [Annulohypoxylon maeteangense]|uniref:uncharacterized protein n=1 Tax=Annulohypoxylon maeteangense TaxID=1927788 RepID=UPI0020077E9C|nr:uncharacterized protein GGS22DRAFT_158982 [Annulohypoxylon maeteangense]KAI0886926.1 hypothetical protein GGS22DRAFT_158982 [Annulohypoxylon maeteangense]
MSQLWTAISSRFVARRAPVLHSKQYPYPRPLSDESDEQAEPLVNESTSDEETVGYRVRKLTQGSSRLYLLSWSVIVILILASGLFGALVMGLVQINHVSWGSVKDISGNNNNRVMVQPCGQSPEEARRAGCHFDVISFCWLPDECWDPELSQQFDDENALEWFLDPNRTQPLSHSQIMTGEYSGLYVNWEYHIRHCTAMWKKMHRAILGQLGNRAIDGYIGVYKHTEHCGEMLLNGREYALDAINTRIRVKYPDCGV